MNSRNGAASIDGHDSVYTTDFTDSYNSFIAKLVRARVELAESRGRAQTWAAQGAVACWTASTAGTTMTLKDGGRKHNVDAIRSIAVEAYITAASCDSTDITCLIVEPCQSGSDNHLRAPLRYRHRHTYTVPTTLRRNFIGYNFISSRTSRPLPEIHAYSLHCYDALGQPYMIVDIARGTRLVVVIKS